jgi:hypothetical protein
VRTRAGLPINSTGAPAAIYVEDDYSLTVTDRNGVLIYSTLNATLAIDEGGSTQPVRWPDGTLGNVGGGFAAAPGTGFVRSGGRLQTVASGFVATEADSDYFRSVLPFVRSIAASVTAGSNVSGSAPLSSDFSVITTATANPSGVTLPPFVSGSAGRRVAVVNRGANPVNVYPDGSERIGTLSAGAPYLLLPGASVGLVRRDATNWEVLGLPGLATSGLVSLAGAANVNIATNLDIFAPSRITVWVRGARLDAAGYAGIQLGTSGSFVTTGYLRVVSSSRTADITSAARFVDIGANNVTGTTWDARYDLRLVASNTWQCNVTGGSGAGFAFSGSGVLPMGGAIDRIRLSATAGAFDNGTAFAEWS